MNLTNKNVQEKSYRNSTLVEPQFYIVRFDVETRSILDLRKVGAWVYAKHPSTEMLTLSFAINNKPVRRFVPNMYNMCQPPSIWKRLVESPTVLFEAFNAFFEWSVYNHVLVDRFGWPAIPPERWRCAMATACYYALPSSLDMVATDALHLEEKKDKEGNRVMLKLAKPRKPTKNNPALFHSKQEDFDKLFEYCDQDVRTHQAIAREIGSLPPGEQLIWQIDQLINRRGVYCDVPAVKGAIAILNQVMGWYQDRIKDLTNGEVTSTGQIKEIALWCQKQGVHLDNVQAATVEATLARDDIPDNVRNVLLTRQAAGKTSTAKYQKMLNMVDLDDWRIRSTLKYHGASTGRWSGFGIQPQNYPRGTFKFYDAKDAPQAPHIEDVVTLMRAQDIDGLKALGSVPEILSSALRSMLCAAPHKKLVAADYSSVEARITMWLVGEERGLNILRTTGLVYEDMASTIYNVPITEVTKDQRWLGKQAVLGLGYQMGWQKFKAQCALYGVEISSELAKKVVNTYRAQYQKVALYWEQINQAALLAVQSKQPITCGKVTLFMEGDFLRIRLPSGRCISYHKPHFVPARFNPTEPALAYWGVDSQSKKWMIQHTYGGKLTENIVQAIAGCILRQASINLESYKYPIVLSVHDELVCEVPDQPEFNIDSMVNLMCAMPQWAEGLPLKAEGWEGQRFKK